MHFEDHIPLTLAYNDKIKLAQIGSFIIQSQCTHDIPFQKSENLLDAINNSKEPFHRTIHKKPLRVGEILPVGVPGATQFRSIIPARKAPFNPLSNPYKFRLNIDFSSVNLFLFLHLLESSPLPTDRAPGTKCYCRFIGNRSPPPPKTPPNLFPGRSAAPPTSKRGRDSSRRGSFRATQFRSIIPGRKAPFNPLSNPYKFQLNIDFSSVNLFLFLSHCLPIAHRERNAIVGSLETGHTPPPKTPNPFLEGELHPLMHDCVNRNRDCGMLMRQNAKQPR
ncbi:hypothetical protein CEXT_365501 [Caerostris extrusa]|uniref:Uncharacterized protein n=1 Tax=Caerostris extrusa TaxID=172846 RepID=A0AAV4UY09_CAEEX|nr:hypothetical protein CEXT_365501 [Caerostris extrusa]